MVVLGSDNLIDPEALCVLITSSINQVFCVSQMEGLNELGEGLLDYLDGGASCAAVASALSCCCACPWKIAK